MHSFLESALLVVAVLSGQTATPDGPTDAKSRLEEAASWVEQAERRNEEGKPVEARRLAERALAVREELLGPDHPETALARGEVGAALLALGELRAAEAQFGRTAPALRSPGREKERAVALKNLGDARRLLCDYDGARACLFEAESLGRKALGESSREFALIRNSLGYYLMELGRLPEARECFEAAVKIQVGLFGEDSARTAVMRINLANCLRLMGDAATARRLYEQSLQHLRRERGERHPSTLVVMNNLASLLSEQGLFREAKPKLEQVLQLSREVHGEEYALTATAMHNLGSVLRDLDQPDASRRLLEAALRLRLKLLGPDHPETAQSRIALSIVLLGQTEVLKSQEQLDLAYQSLRRTLGPQHRTTAQVGMMSGFQHLFRGEYAKAKTLLGESLRTQQAEARTLISTLSGAEAMAYTANTDSARDSLLSTLRHLPGDHADEAYRIVLDYRALVTRSLMMRRQAVEEIAAARPVLEELRATAGRLAALAQRVPADEKAAESLREQTRALTAEKEKLERSLAGLLVVQGSGVESQDVGPGDVAKHLGADTALVEFVRTEQWNLRLRTQEEMKRMNLAQLYQYLRECDTINGPHYEAFVLRAADTPTGYTIRRVDLGKCKQIDEDVRSWRVRIRRDSTAAEPDDPRAREPDQKLRENLWAPLEPLLDGCRHLVIVPDADLTRLPWPALPTNREGEPLASRYVLSTLNHAQQLPELRTRRPTDRSAFLLVGGVEHGKPADSAKPRWTPLPGTEAEVDQLASVCRGKEVRVLRGGDAGEKQVRAGMPTARFVHLATHGFFAEPRAHSIFQPGLRPAFAMTDLGSSVPLVGRNPLTLSGVVLAGANHSTSGAESDDGLLMAEEVVGLNLRQTEMVVLSACDTGLGEVAAGEGVFGLQRAFLLAGARSVLASLWKVDDDATALLMTRFYQNLLGRRPDGGGPMPRAAALREAMLWLRDLPRGDADTLRADLPRERGGVRTREAGDPAAAKPYAHPYYWSGFVLIGDPG